MTGKFGKFGRDNGMKDFSDSIPDGSLVHASRIPSAPGRGTRIISGFQAAADKWTASYSGELGVRGQ